MKKIFIVLFILVSFFAFSQENGEVIFDAYEYCFDDYQAEVEAVFFIPDGNVYDFRIYFNEKKTNTLYVVKAKLNEPLLRDEGYKIDFDSIKNRQYKIILYIVSNKITGEMYGYPVFIFSKEKNKYKKVDSFDNIELDKRT